MKHRPQFLLAGALLVAVMALAALNQPSRPASANGNRGACCPFPSVPNGLLATAGTNGAASNTNPPAVTNRF
jgi:hypothetical protein